jgi:TatD DNase family protein
MHHLPRTLNELRALAADPRCAAIGECGLDFNRNFSPPDVQEVWFDKQVCILLTVRSAVVLLPQDAGLESR